MITIKLNNNSIFEINGYYMATGDRLGCPSHPLASMPTSLGPTGDAHEDARRAPRTFDALPCFRDSRPHDSARRRHHGRPPRVLAEEAHQLPRGIGAVGVGMRAVAAPTRPGVAGAVDGPPLHDGPPAGVGVGRAGIVPPPGCPPPAHRRGRRGPVWVRR